MPDALIQKIENLREDIEEIFATFPIPLAGKRVLIKPNMLSDAPPERGITTSPQIISAIVKRVERETEDIIVGDNPSGTKFDVEEMARRTGILEASCGYFKVFSEARHAEVNSRFIKSVLVSKEILDADVIINVPRAKTHALTRMTCCIKNMFGVVPGGLKTYLHTLAPSYEMFSELMVDIYGIAPPTLNIVDATTMMEGYGPSNGALREYGRLISGRNGVAVDAVVAHIMGLPAEKVAMLSIAQRRGMGETDLKEMEIEGELEAIKNFSLPPASASSLIGRFNRFWDIATSKPAVIEDKCVKCYECMEACLSGAIKKEGEDAPHIMKEKCISCFCCLEICKNGAIGVPDKRIEMIERMKDFILDRI